MLVFWIIAALLLAFCLAALLWPLLRMHKAPSTTSADAPTSAGVSLAVLRDQLQEAERDLSAGLITPERFAEAQAELQRRTLEDTTAAATPTAANTGPARATAMAVALLVGLGSVLIYLVLGQPEAMDPMVSAAPPSEQELAAKMTEAVAQLEVKLKDKPDNAEGWRMLGRSRMVLGQHALAAEAYRQAARLQPQDAGVLADLADALGMANGATLAGEPTRLIAQALKLDPAHGKALALAGSAAFEAGQFAKARGHWEALLARVQPDTEVAQSIKQSIEQAREKEATGGAASSAQAGKPAPAAAQAFITGEVALSPGLAARVKPGDTVFIFARAAEGPRMPIAALKKPANELPFSFRLDDSMALAAGRSLAGSGALVVGARISSSGSATPASGDLTGLSSPVAAGSMGVKVVIDQVTP